MSATTRTALREHPRKLRREKVALNASAEPDYAPVANMLNVLDGRVAELKLEPGRVFPAAELERLE